MATCDVCGRPEWGGRYDQAPPEQCSAGDAKLPEYEARCYEIGYARERAARAQAERERDALFARLQAATGRHQQEVDTLIDSAAAAEAALAELRLANTSLAEALAEAKSEWHPESLRAQWDKHKRIAEENKALTAALAEARAEAQRLRGLLQECAATLGCGERDEDGWDSGHWCTHCDDFVDRNMVLRKRIDAELAPAGTPQGQGK